MEVICKKDGLRYFTVGKSYIAKWVINTDDPYEPEFELETKDDEYDNHVIAYSDDKDTSDDEWFNEYFDVV